jgi:hypothetical protein
MQYDADRAGDLALALLYLTLHDGTRVWKGVDWDVLAHLHARGLIEDPRNRAKSLVLTEAGLERAEAMFREYLAPAG